VIELVVAVGALTGAGLAGWGLGRWIRYLLEH
jgi:hypothetical protein